MRHSENSDNAEMSFKPPGQEQVLKILSRVGFSLGVAVDRSDVHSVESLQGDEASDALLVLRISAQQSGIFLKKTGMATADDATELVREGFPVILAGVAGSFVVLEKLVGRKIEASIIGDRVTTHLITRGQLGEMLASDPPPITLVAKKELECDSISAAPGHRHGHHHEHPTPLRRFLGLLNFDRRDIGSIVLFAFVAGVLALATPLAVESLVNVVSWGTYLQPLIVLGLMLLTCLGFAGVLKVLQTVVVEMIQRRQFVRIVSDLAHRFPRANQASLVGEYPRELANRVFDIMTIQKATAVLLLDGVSIVLTTMLGLVLLAFYHPFLLGFDIVLVIAMISITWLLGRGGIRTAIEESLTKYEVAHWLQDVLASPSVFKTGGGEALAIARANQLTADYINARQQTVSRRDSPGRVCRRFAGRGLDCTVGVGRLVGD